MKLKAIISGVIWGVALLVIPGPVDSEFDLAGLNDQVQQHEARIGDLEKRTDDLDGQVTVQQVVITRNSEDIQALQAQVTPPDSTPEQGPEVAPETSPEPVSEPQEPRPTVIRYETKLVGGPNNGGGYEFECWYYFSDDTSEVESRVASSIEYQCQATPREDTYRYR